MALNIGRYNGWIPSPAVYNAYFNHIVWLATTPFESRGAHAPPVEEFRQDIQANPVMVQLFDKNFLQAEQHQVQSFDHTLHLSCLIVTSPPRLMAGGAGQTPKPIGVPWYLVFDLPSNTSAAYNLFRMEAFNQALKKLLNSWSTYLTTSDSNRTLTDADDGWFGPDAMQSLEELGLLTFNQTYLVPDPDAVDRGHRSWDAFFTRGIQPNARPIVPAQGRAIIYNACESTVERITFNVRHHDKFWFKGTMAYSFHDIFNGDDNMAQQFIGGTVYQAFLSPQDYHRVP